MIRNLCRVRFNSTGRVNSIRSLLDGANADVDKTKAVGTAPTESVDSTNAVGPAPTESVDSVNESAMENANEGVTNDRVDINEVPWYLRDNSTSPLIETKKIELPEIPHDAPASIPTFLNLLAYDYGLSDITLFDLKTLPESHPYSSKNQLVDFVILSTGKSEKHIYKAAAELRHYIKHNHDILPVLEGMVSASLSPAARRRLLRRARKGPPATDNDYGKNPNSWVMCNTLVDDIHVHMMTKERREELLLETVYCSDEDLHKYERGEDTSFDSDNIFTGIRRFHSSSINLQLLAAIYEKTLLSEISNIDKVNFDSIFEKHPTLDNHKLRFNFYKALHFAGKVLFDELENMLLSKYSDLEIMMNAPEQNLSDTIVSDIVEYTKMLIDEPAEENIRQHADETLDKLSIFISKVVRFSSQEIDLLLDSSFVPLLWRLSFSENEPFIGSQIINEIIYNESEIPTGWSQKVIDLANNRARDISDLIKYHNKQNNRVPTLAYRELILQTYGNSGKWDQFWREWNTSFNTLQNQSLDSKSLVLNWVRLAVYLAVRNDKSSILQFFYGYWSNSSIGRTFINDFEMNELKFNSQEEKVAFERAIRKMLDSIDEDFTSVKQFLDGVNSVNR